MPEEGAGRRPESERCASARSVHGKSGRLVRGHPPSGRPRTRFLLVANDGEQTGNFSQQMLRTLTISLALKAFLLTS